MNDLTTQIKQLLDDWQDTQFNIKSDSARQMLANAINKEIQPTINKLIEDIVCPANEPRW